MTIHDESTTAADVHLQSLPLPTFFLEQNGASHSEWIKVNLSPVHRSGTRKANLKNQ